ncbi:hypothetical protein DL768_005732 [Monosporascus sp. mg162]|nr:hypothetical protein DL768_005732 [Monosporascus sp. mg162]
MATAEATPEPAALPVGSYDTALCLIPPRHTWSSIDRLRMLYDKAYEKWPPHVNIVYPFVGVDSLSSASEMVVSELRAWKEASGAPKLRIRLGEADAFSHRQGGTIFICDKDPARAAGLSELRNRVLGALRQSPGSYQMHMTIGQSDDASSASHEFLLEKASLLPAVEWDVEELHILIRERMKIDGNATSQMKIWGVIDVATLSVSRMAEPVAIYETETLAQGGVDSEHDVEARNRYTSRLPYVFSSSERKWKVHPGPSSQLEESVPESLTVASYNVLAEFEYPPSQDRYPLVVQNLLGKSGMSDVVVLEEVTDDFLSYLLRDDRVREEYPFTSCGPPEQSDIEPLPSHLNSVVLSKLSFSWDWVPFRRRHKGSVIVRFDSIGKRNGDVFLPAVLSTVHLTCGLTDGSVANKKLELQSILKYLSKTYPENPWIVAGDFNITTSAYTVNAALKKKAISSQTADNLTEMEIMINEVGLTDAWSFSRVQYGDSSFDEDQRHLCDVFEGEEGATFDPTVNELAAEMVGSGFNNRPQRYDRILVKGQDLFTVSGFNTFGKNRGLLGSGAVADDSSDTQGKLSYASDHWGIRCSLKLASDTSEQTMDDSSKLSVEIQVKAPPDSLADVSELRECLDKQNVFPSEGDISEREAAFALLKEVILDDGESGHVRGKPAFVVVPVGSYGLGAWTASSDIDCLCIGPISSRVFFALAVQRLRKAATRGIKVLRRVNAHSGTMLELEVLGITMDLQYCPSTFIAETWPHAMRLPPSDPVFTLPTQTLAKLKPVRDLYYIRRTIPDYAAFKVAYQLVKCWAKQRGIYAAKFGYLGGIHISILLSRVCKLLSYDGKRVSVPIILMTFFDHYAGFDWKSHMAFDPFFHKRLRYVRTAREPMVILGYHAPSLNTAHTASPPSVRTISEELKRASALLSQEGMTWCGFIGSDGHTERAPEAGAAEFLSAYKTYVRIDVQFWGVSLAKGSSFVGWLESRCVMLLVDLNRRLPSMHARIWPARFVGRDMSEEDKDYQGYYLIGLDRLEGANNEAMGKDDMKIIIGTLRTVLETFERQIQGDEKYFDSKSCWMSASLVKQSEVSHLRLDGREWGEYTIGDDESEEEEEEEEEEGIEQLDSGADAPASSKSKKRPVHGTPTLPSRPAYTGKFRSSADVISRLRWDPEMDSSDYIVGYEDRFLGIRERPLDQWKSEQTDEEFIPQHRIEYFKRKSDGVVVWDRKQRRDDIFGSGVSSLPRGVAS